MDISLVIPTINSEKFIKNTINELYDYFKNKDLLFEIIIIQDSDEEDLWKIIKKLCESRENLYGIKLYKNFGQHFANQIGFIKAKGKFVVTLDDDGNIHPDQIDVLIAKQKSTKAELVIGNYINKNQTLVRKLGTFLINVFFRINYGLKKGIKISNFRLIKKNLIKRVISTKVILPFTSAQLLDNTNQTSWAAVLYRNGYRKNSSYNLKSLTRLLFSVIIFYSNNVIKKLTNLYLIICFLTVLSSIIFLLLNIINNILFIFILITSIFLSLQVFLLRVLAKYYESFNNKKGYGEIISSIDEIS